MVIMSLIPTIWFSIMDPLAEAYKKERNIKEAQEKSVKMTRKFVLQLFFVSLGMLVFCKVLGLDPN